MIKLGVNIDHVATIRQARKTNEPDPVDAAFVAEKAGAEGITIHLREDRRHIQDRDVRMLRQMITTRMNLEMGMSEDIISVALDVKPEQVTLVPEKREEVTTEGGLDVAADLAHTTEVVKRFHDAGIIVSLFIDPEEEQIAASAASAAEFIEFHTGCYANAWPSEDKQKIELDRIVLGVELARKHGLRVNAGHGLTYRNVAPIAAIEAIEELNIGHSIISRAVMTGLGEAVSTMKRLMLEARA
ncbi:MAG: pyridoxine 5'-phosphate synthase [Planctomycetes bacterium]|nr:pyridoxine 5'-phosphate synthase [Planctomycetota bacterium]